MYFPKLYIDPATSGILINFFLALISSTVYFFRKIFIGKLTNPKYTQNEIGLFSEGNQYINTFQPIVNQLINEKIHFNYYTLDYNDKILEIKNEYLHSTFLGLGVLGRMKFNSIKVKKLISTTPNIGNKNYDLKKPKKVNELIHVWHSIDGISYYNKGSLDFYDTILTVGDYQNDSIRKIEEVRELKNKKLVPVGLLYYDVYLKKIKPFTSKEKTILVGSSWGKKGLLNKVGKELISELSKNYKIIVRPHPQSFLSEIKMINELKKTFEFEKNILWDELIDPVKSISSSSLLVSDSSSIRYDFAFLTNRPVITIKIDKKDLQGYEADDLNVLWDEKNENLLGETIKDDEIKLINEKIKNILSKKTNADRIKKLKSETIYCQGKSAVNIVKYLTKN